jgi:hypothetical protein
MSRFFRRAWDERRGDQHDSWGTSVWYFDLDEERYPSRQLVVYSSGDTLAYDREHLDDEYGGLGDQALEGDEWSGLEITADEFEAAWKSAKPRNRESTDK